MSAEGKSRSTDCYRARRPELTDWYQVTNGELSTLQKLAEQPPIEGRGYLRPEVLGTFEALLECGLPQFGLARFHCDGCGKDLFVALSCRRRGLCHSCHAYRQEKLVQFLLNEVLPWVPYCQWVISFPKRIRPFFRYDPSLNKAVSRIVADVIVTYFRKLLGYQQLDTSVVAFDQSFGALLGYHPHQHLLSCGGFLGDGCFVELETIKESHVILLEEVLRRRILLLLQQLTFSDLDKQLPTKSADDPPKHGNAVTGVTRVFKSADNLLASTSELRQLSLSETPSLSQFTKLASQHCSVSSSVIGFSKLGTALSFSFDLRVEIYLLNEILIKTALNNLLFQKVGVIFGRCHGKLPRQEHREDGVKRVRVPSWGFSESFS